ncbi:response regulator transcription factor [Aureimonas sp. AU4]|uniref:response regulator transcription factor n=1 Tax=Aureimonas sp. AU4 TaxID=1638163 RepID=UPI0007829D80|nr:response regulator transcription factor [Aureimonas sp. AU4]
MDKKHILVVEDDNLQREVIAEYLTRSGFEVLQAPNGASFREFVRQRPIDLAIVDLQLPDADGFDLIRVLRETRRCGIIVLTANDDPTDRVVGLEVGADDFVVKPHPPRELLARVRSVLRRLADTEVVSPPRLVAEPPVMDFGGWTLDVLVRGLRGPTTEQIDLTISEFALLKELLAHPGEVMERDQLMRNVFHRPWSYEDRSLDVLVARLRRKLEPAAGSMRIGSVRGTGYVLSGSTLQ